MQKILIGVTGSIAAYKVAELIRLLKKSNHQVRVVMTTAATQIITPMTLQVLSQYPVRTELFDHENEAKIDHIALARWPDKIIIAPATANFMAKAAAGIADDLLTTICLATDAPIAIAPAMNRLMWENSATQANLHTLRQRGYQLIAPDNGEQACGEVGIGRMVSPETLASYLSTTINRVLTDKHLVITAGPTIERIDPVPYLSNDSSGKMGYALATAAIKLGAKVTLISGKTTLTPPHGVNFINVESAQSMYDHVMHHIDKADWFIATAAVADYYVKNPSQQKLKKHNHDKLTLILEKNPDILASVCALPNRPFCLGFAAETEQVVKYAKQKRLKKGVDLIAANDVSDKCIGFNSNNNAITLIGDNYQQDFPMMDKQQLAMQLLVACLDYQKQKQHQTPS